MSKILAQGMITLTQLYEGAQVILTPSAVLIPCDSQEAPKPNAYINAFTNVRAFLGTMDITSKITLGTLEYSDSTVRASKTGTKVSITTITTRTGYVDIPVSVTIDGETIDLGKHRFSFVKQIDGQTGQTGAQGAPGFSYTLNIKGGTRGVAYAANGTNPEPKTSSQFSVELLKNGVKVANPASISWTCGGNLSGSSSTATFTPTIKSTYNSESSYVKVSVKEFAASLAVEETIPIVCTKHADGLDWINEWNNQYVQVGTEKIITPKIFAGTKNSANELTGVAIGRDVLGGNANKVIGIVGYKKNTPVFSLDQDANFFVSSSGSAGDVKNGTNNAKGIYFDGNNLYVSGRVRISGGSTIGENNTSVEDVINNSNLGVQANNKLNNLSIGGRNLIRKADLAQNNSTATYDGATNTWTVNATAGGGGTWGCGLVVKNKNALVPYGKSYVLSFEIKVPRACSWNCDVNNYALTGSSWSGNDNDVTSKRTTSSKSLAANQWIKCWIKWENTNSNNTNKVDIYDNSNFGVVMKDETSNMTYQIRNVKGELGNVPTEWTPAPEDVQADIDKKANNSEVYKKTETYSKTQTDSAIEVAKNEINLGISSTYETKTNVETKISSANTTTLNSAKSYADTKKSEAITQAGKDADSKVNSAKNELSTKINDIQVGGRNLFLNSGFTKGLNYWYTYKCSNPQAVADSSALSGYAVKFTSTGGGIYQRKGGASNNPTNYPNGSVMTVSGYVKSSVANKVLRPNFENGGTNTSKNITCTNANTWYYFTHTHKIASNGFSTITFYGDSGADYYLKDVMFEYGNKASTWTPAPEDVAANIDTAKAEAINSANSTLTTTIANYYTKEQTNSQINIAKEAINLGVSNTYETKANVETKVSSTLNSAKSYADTKKAEAINSAASDAANKVNSAKNELNTKINDIQVGGRNLWIEKNLISAYESSGNATNSTSQHKMMNTYTDLNGAKYITVQLWNPNSLNNTSNSNRIAFYDNNKTWIGSIGSPKPNGTTYVSGIITVPTNAKYMKIGMITGVSQHESSIKIKVELGNKATGWSPAPEDTTADINTAKNEAINSANNTLTTTIANYYTKEQTNSQINIAKNEINLGVSNTYETKTNVETKVSSAKTEAINAASTDATNKVNSAKNELNTTINNIQVGGVNRLTGTATTKNTNVNVPTSYVTFDPYTTPNKQTLEALGFKVGDKVTISFDWSISQNGSNAYTYGNFRLEFKGINSEGVDNQYVGLIKNPVATFSSSNKKGTEVITTTLNSSTIKAHTLRFRIDNSVLNFKVSNVKLEKGNKPTTWSPAPEDVSKDIANAKTEAINSANSTLTTTIANYYTKAQTDSQINVAKDAINLAVSNTYETKTNVETKVNNAVNNIQVGGRNLALKTSNNYSTAYSNFNGSTNICPALAKVLTDGLKVGDIVTVRLLYKYTNIVATSGQTAKCWIQGNGNVTVWNSGAFHGSPQKVISGSGEHEFKYSFTVIADHLKNEFWNTSIRHDYVQSGSVQWKLLKIEKGNKATDWTPAPEDIQSQIDTHTTQINTTNNKVSSIETNLNSITSRVSATETTTSSLTTQMNNKENKNDRVIYAKGSGNDAPSTSIVKVGSSTLVNGHGRGLNIVALNPTTLAQQYNGRFDTYGGDSGRSDFANKIKELNNGNYIIVVTSTDSASLNTDTVCNALYLIGGSAPSTSVPSYREAYALIGKSKLGKGNGLEMYIPKTATDARVAEVSVKVSDQGALLGVNSNNSESKIDTLTTRVSTAESKLTKDSLTTTIGNHYTTSNDVNGIVTSKGYQTQSQVQQTVDGLQVKVQQSGGYNLLRNSGFKKDSLHWGTQSHNSPTGGSIGYLNHTAEWGFPNANVKCCQIRLSNQTNKEYGIAQTFNTTIGKKYTISFYYAGHRVPKANMIIRGTTSSSSSWLTNKNFVPTSKNGGNSSVNNWALFTHTFTATLNSHTLNIVINDANDNGYMWIAQPMIEEGELYNPYSPHSSEVYDGITAIDKDGITVTSSNVKSKTQMSANGFKITKTDTNEDVFKVNSDGTLVIKGNITVTGGSIPTSNLSGTISSSQLNSSITTDITNAKNNASTALSTANTASTNATNAVNTANTAKNTADSAKTTANTASTNATNAVNTANTAKSTADSAKTTATNAVNTANTAKNTADSVNNTLNSNKVNWNNAYERVKQWASGAITGSTTINGGMIEANTIVAEKIAIGDFTNYAQLNEATASKLGFIKEPNEAGGAWLRKNGMARDIFISDTHTCNGGESFRIKLDISTTIKGNSSNGGTDSTYRGTAIGLYCYNGTGSSVGIVYSTRYSNTTVNGSSSYVTIPASTRKFRVFIQTDSYGNFSGDLKVRNVQVTKMANGELIVDGSIKTSMIHSDGLNASIIKAGHISADRLDANTIVSKVNGGTTEINGNRIQTGTLSADKITTGTLDANKVNVTNIKAGNIVSGTIDASKISVTNLNASNITSGTLRGGGYNLLRNSGFKNEKNYWSVWHHNNPTGGIFELISSSATWGYPDASVKTAQIRLSNQSSIEYGIAQNFNTTIGKQYTLTFQYAGHRISGANAIIRGANGSWLAHKYFTPTDFGGGSDNVNKWGTYSLTFTATATSHTLNIVINTAQNDGYLWVAKPQIVEGAMTLPYSPHPNEIYDGLTVIDADGITVNNGAIKIKNKAGNTVLSGDSNGNLTLNGTIKSEAGNGQYVAINSGGITFRDHQKSEEILRLNTSFKGSNRDINGVTFAMPQYADFLSFTHIAKPSLENGWSASSETFYNFMDMWSTDYNDANGFKQHKGINVYAPMYLSQRLRFRNGSDQYLHEITPNITWNNMEKLLGVFGDNGTMIGFKSADDIRVKIVVTEGNHPNTGDSIRSWGNWNCTGATVHNATFNGRHVNSYTNTETRTICNTAAVMTEGDQVRVNFENVQIKDGKAILSIPKRYRGINEGYTIASIVKKGRGDVWVSEEGEERFIIEAENDIKINIEIIIKLTEAVVARTLKYEDSICYEVPNEQPEGNCC